MKGMITFPSDYIPYHELDINFLTGPLKWKLFHCDLASNGGGVGVLELVEHEPSNEAGFANRGVP